MAAGYGNRYAGGNMHLTEHEQAIVDSLPYQLESYYYVSKQRFVDIMREHKAQVFIDSGAFSAHTLGATINIEDYCQYLIENRDIIRHEDGVMIASVLDGIGDPLQTYRNQLHMEALGVRPLPCFHYGEDERYLEWYMDHYEYITLGGMVGHPTPTLIRWLDRIWDRYLVDGSGRPKLKIHGFGVTSVPLMERYPWHSCDSSSWIQYAAYGHIFMPDYGVITVSAKSPKRHIAGQHLSTFTPIEQEYILGKIEEAGFNYERLSTSYESRAAYNLWSFTKINEAILEHGAKTFKATVLELF